MQFVDNDDRNSDEMFSVMCTSLSYYIAPSFRIQANGDDDRFERTFPNHSKLFKENVIILILVSDNRI